jgi:hypothetical protein
MVVALVVAVALATVAVAASGGAAPGRAAPLPAAARRAPTTRALQARLQRALSALVRTPRPSRGASKRRRSRSITVVVPPGVSCAVSGGGGCSLTPCLYFVPATPAATATVGPGLRAPAAGAAARRTRPRCRAPRTPTRPILS